MTPLYGDDVHLFGLEASSAPLSETWHRELAPA